jgi:hypothetical protein
MFLEEIGLHAQNTITIIGSIGNIKWGGESLEIYISCNEHENFHFDNE